MEYCQWCYISGFGQVSKARFRVGTWDWISSSSTADGTKWMHPYIPGYYMVIIQTDHTTLLIIHICFPFNFSRYRFILWCFCALCKLTCQSEWQMWQKHQLGLSIRISYILMTNTWLITCGSSFTEVKVALVGVYAAINLNFSNHQSVPLVVMGL